MPAQPWCSVRCLLIALTLALAARGAVAARQEALPEARAVFARHLAAVGGEAAQRALRSVHARGRLQVASQGLAGDIELFAARPAKLLVRVTVPGIGVIENGYDGATGWAVSPIAGPEVLSGRQLSEAADDAFFDSPLHPASHVREAMTVARETFDGKPSVKVRVVLASGNEQFEYFDVASGLQTGSEASRQTPQGVVPVVNILRNYRACGGVMQPTVYVQRALGIEQVVTVAACETNTLTDTPFEPPAVIKALRAQ